LRRHLRHPAAHRHPLADGDHRRPLRVAGGHPQPHRERPADRLRRAHHPVPRHRARRPQPAVAQHPQLLPGLALRVLRPVREKRRTAMRRFLAILIGLALALGLATPHPAAAADPIVIGLQCDRTGPTGNIGSTLCPGYHDYVKLVNSKGGIEGHQIKVDEVDIEYKVPPAVEAYERFKKEGAVLVGIYGTPQTYALA